MRPHDLCRIAEVTSVMRCHRLPQPASARAKRQWWRNRLSEFMQWFPQHTSRRECESLCWAFITSLLLIMSCPAAHGAVAQESPTLEVRQFKAAEALTSVKVVDGRLSVNLKEADLGDALSRVGHEAGFVLKMMPTAQKTISAQFVDMTLIQGVRRLLRLASLSYAMVYDEKDQATDGLKELWVFGMTKEGASDFQTAAARNEASDTDREPSQQQSASPRNPLLAVLNGQRPEPVPPSRKNPLTQAMGGEQVQPTARPQASFTDFIAEQSPSRVQQRWHVVPQEGNPLPRRALEQR